MEHARRVVAVGEIPGGLSSYVDIGTVDVWSKPGSAAEKLAKSVVDGRLVATDLDTAQRLSAWTGEPADAIAAGFRLAHGDLEPDQIFGNDDGYRVVDW